MAVRSGTSGNDTLVGTGVADILTGLDGDDLLNAGTGNDTLFGGVGRDTLEGMAGDDHLVGGDGYDVAVYGGIVADFDIRIGPSGTVVEDRTAFLGDEGRDVLDEVEEVRFADHTLYLDGRNNAVIARTDILSGREDTTLGIDPSDLLANDRDVDGDVPRIVSVASGSGGEVHLRDDGTVAFQPERDFNGHAVFTYVVSDGRGGDDTGTVAVVVKRENDGPVIEASTVTGGVTEVADLAAD